jgi:hypothetical protein
MDTGHLHLMLNHLPVLGVPALLGLLLWGLARDMPAVARGALWLTLALSVVTAAVYLTGEAAEELVEGMPTFQESLVERHEGVALWTTVMVVGTGLLAAAALYRSARGSTQRSKALVRLVVAGLALSTIALGVTAWTGGPIGHPELRQGGVTERASSIGAD